MAPDGNCWLNTINPKKSQNLQNKSITQNIALTHKLIKIWIKSNRGARNVHHIRV